MSISGSKRQLYAVLERIITNKFVPHQLGVALPNLIDVLVRKNLFSQERRGLATLYNLFLENRLRPFSFSYLDALKITYAKKQGTRRVAALEKTKEILQMQLSELPKAYYNVLSNTLQSMSIYNITSRFLKNRYETYLRKLVFARDPVSGVTLMSELYRDAIPHYPLTLGKLILHFDYYMFLYFTSNKAYLSSKENIYKLIEALKNRTRKPEVLAYFTTLFEEVQDLKGIKTLKKSWFANYVNKLNELNHFVAVSSLALAGEYSATVQHDSISLFQKIFSYLVESIQSLKWGSLLNSWIVTLQSYFMVYDNILYRTMEKVVEREYEQEQNKSSSNGDSLQYEDIVLSAINKVITGEYSNFISEELRQLLLSDYLFVKEGYYLKLKKLIRFIENRNKVKTELLDALREVTLGYTKTLEVETVTKREKMEEEKKEEKKKKGEKKDEMENLSEVNEQEPKSEVDEILDELTIEGAPSEASSGTEHNIQVQVGEISSQPKEEARVLFEKYKLLETLRTDDYVKTYLVLDDKDTRVILKQFLPTMLSSNLKSTFDIVKKGWTTASPNLVPKLIDAKFEAKDKIYIVREYLPKTFADLIKEGFESSDAILDAFVDITKLLDTFHKAFGRIHGNLKPSNLLISSGGYKFVDFGQVALKKQIAGSLTKRDICYMTPEQIAGTYTEKSFSVDIWQLGVLFFETLTRRNPFSMYSSVDEIKTAITSEGIPFDNEIPPDLMTLITEMCDKNPKNRPSLMEVTRRLYLI